MKKKRDAVFVVIEVVKEKRGRRGEDHPRY